jgi:hypothetical protein
MGAFASMAQNGYGLIILGGVAFAIALVFLYQLKKYLDNKEKKDIGLSIELFSLFLVATILGLRVFYIHFPFIEVVFELGIVALIIVYLQNMTKYFVSFKSKSTSMSILILLFYIAIIFYFISLAFVPILAQFSGLAGVIAMVFLLLFISIALLLKNVLMDGEKVSVFKIVAGTRGNAVLLICLFSLFTLYEGFTRTGVFPRIYSDEFPQAYFEMVNKAESGKEIAVKGRYRYQDFKEKYDAYLEDTK